MKTTTQQSPTWSSISGAFIALANAGALVSVIVLTVSFLMATPVIAQEINVDMSEVEEELAQAAIEIQEALEDMNIETGIHINIDDEGDDARPKLGVYLSDMDFEDAYKMRYPFAHGVLVDGVTNNGSADRSGIIEDDIIMYFDGTKVLYEDHLVRLIRSKKFGDKVQVLFWRDEAQDTTYVTFMAPVKKEKKESQLTMDDKKKKDKKRRNSRGFGGGGFTPMFVQDKFVDVTTLMAELSLLTTPFSSDGVVLWGGSGQGYVGNGWFLGGFGNGTTLSSTAIVPIGSTKLDRDINFSMGLGGLTIEKRLAPFSWATLSGGVGIGGAGMNLSVTQTDGDFNWLTVGDSLLTTTATSVDFSKSYAMVHPRASLMLRLTGWMRIKAEYGYLYGIPFSDGWKTTLAGSGLDDKKNNYQLAGSPNTPLEASTISIGLWFGF